MSRQLLHGLRLVLAVLFVCVVPFVAGEAAFERMGRVGVALLAAVFLGGVYGAFKLFGRSARPGDPEAQVRRLRERGLLVEENEGRTSDLHFERIERQLADALPELRPAADHYWKTEGVEGTDCGAYIFFEDLFASYVEVLLALPASPRRDALLHRAFSFVERMLASDDGRVCDLAFIAIYEHRHARWLARAAAFIGPLAVAELDRREPGWRKMRGREPRSEHLDGYGVRRVIAAELRAEGVTLSRVPGTTHAQDL